MGSLLYGRCSKRLASAIISGRAHRIPNSVSLASYEAIPVNWKLRSPQDRRSRNRQPGRRQQQPRPPKNAHPCHHTSPPFWLPGSGPRFASPPRTLHLPPHH
jgi:hypothetical protein